MIENKAKVLEERLIYEIAAGLYQPDGKLPSERSFCERYAISRTTARQALENLERDGLIRRRPSSGAYLTPDALEIVAARKAPSNAPCVVFLMPLAQINNQILQRIFTSCRDSLGKRANLHVVFDDERLNPSLKQLKPEIVVCFQINCPERLAELEKLCARVVLLNTKSERYGYISADNFLGGRIMARHLVSLGHRKLGCVGPRGDDDLCDFAQRRLGIQSVCDEAGVEIEDAILSLESYLNLSASCHQAVDKLLLRMPDMSAILALYDLPALFVCESLRMRGVPIPDGMSVMGFDDQFFAAYTVPPLTTVKYPAEAIGMKLAAYVESFAGGSREIARESIEPLLCERPGGSTGKIKREEVAR